MRYNNRAYTDQQILTTLVAVDGASGGFIKDADRATDDETRSQVSTSKVLTPSNLAGAASFKTTLSANQTGIATATATKLAFNTESWDTGSFFDTTNNRWTPPAGKVALQAKISFTGTWAIGNTVFLMLYKNGSLLEHAVPFWASVANAMRCHGVWVDSANGTDFYEAYVQATIDSGTGTVSNVAANSNFAGWQL